MKRFSALTLRRSAGTFGFVLSVPLAFAIGSVAPAAPVRPSTPSVPSCEARSLVIWGGLLTAATGTMADEFGFTNTSDRSCVLVGYPRVQMLNSSGGNEPTFVHRATGSFAIKETAVLLAPGETAYFRVIFHDSTGYLNSTCPTSSALRFTPPENTKTITMMGKRARIAAYGGSTTHLDCGNVSVTAVTSKRFP